MSNIEFRIPTKLRVEQCHPREWNPNEMTPAKQKQLHDKIMSEGFTDPIKVCKVDPREHRADWDQSVQHYWIWAGEHRWKFCKEVGEYEIPAIIYEGKEWTEEQQKIKTVQDNLIHGQLNDAKFTDLVNSLDPANEVLPHDFGFDDDADMARHLIVEKDKAEKKLVNDLEAEANEEKPQAADLHKIVSEVVQQTASTVDQNYLWFTHNGQRICVVLCDEDTKLQVEDVVKQVTKTGGTLNQALGQALSDWLDDQ